MRQYLKVGFFFSTIIVFAVCLTYVFPEKIDDIMLMENRFPSYWSFLYSKHPNFNDGVDEKYIEDKLIIPKNIINNLSYRELSIFFNNSNYLPHIYQSVIVDLCDGSNISLFNGKEWIYREKNGAISKVNNCKGYLFLDGAIEKKKIGISGMKDYEFDNGNKLSDITNMYLYLSLFNHEEVIFISAKDEASRMLDKRVRREMNLMGLDCLIWGKYTYSYIGIVDSGKAVYEDTSLDLLIKEGTIEGDNTSFKITSAGLGAGNYSSIIIDDKEYSMNSRGLNIVVYDKTSKKVIDSVAFDTYDYLNCTRTND